MAAKVESVILKTLINDENYSRKVFPYIKPEYFEDPADQNIYKSVYGFFEKYGKLPTVEAIGIEVSKKSEEQSVFDRTEEILVDLKTPYEAQDETWMINETEKFCQDRAIYLALSDSIAIHQGKDKKRDKGAIPQILSDALAVSFDPKIGHDYLEESEERYEFYHRKAYKIPFDLEKFNEITKGGVEKKTLNVVMAGIGVGKTIFLCHESAFYLTQGMNVLYITMEMADKKIAQRIDANLMGITIDELMALPHNIFTKKIQTIRNNTKGKYIVKEYPTGGAHSGHFRHLLNELKLKKAFKPDVIMVDYINICASSRLKKSAGSAETSYVIKSVAEELRSLAQELDIPIWTATQFNKEGFDSSDPSMTDVAESWGIPQTADFMFAMIGGDTFEKLKQRMIKQIKNRYADDHLTKKFVVGINKAKMQFYNVEESAQKGLDDAGEPQPKTTEQDGYTIRQFGKSKIDKKKFDNVKVE